MDKPLNDISLGFLYRACLDHRRLVVLITIASAGIGVATAVLLPNIYRAQITLAPVSGIEGGAAGLSGKLGGLAALAGVGTGTEDRQVEALATLTSRSLTYSFIRQQNLLPVLFDSEWDTTSTAWREQDPEKIPTAWDAFKIFNKKIRKVTVDRQTNLVTLTIDWKDRKQAAEWATGLVFQANSFLKQRAIDRAKKNLNYLNEQLGITSVLEVRQAVYKLIENEIKTIMLAQSSDEYAFKIIDGAVIPQEKNSPKRTAIVLVAIIIGAFAGCLIAAFRGPRPIES